MKKAFFKYFTLLVVFTFSVLTSLNANAFGQAATCNSGVNLKEFDIVSDASVNFSNAFINDAFDLKIALTESEESEKAVYKKLVQVSPFLGFSATFLQILKVNNKSLIQTGIFCNSLSPKRFILFQVFRI